MKDHLEVTVGVDPDQYSHPEYEDSPSAPVQPMKVGFEPVEEEKKESYADRKRF